ncbi:hypothetical protein [Guptibacillus spartinae]|uniref:hypothetical protein n=1 Tax=Guptibacillus spartinae TaxID=3025679 RepID=UPI00236289C0|nr:hypothetical protein [Pseudalkalibacillus spartinae]
MRFEDVYIGSHIIEHDVERMEIRYTNSKEPKIYAQQQITLRRKLGEVEWHVQGVSVYNLKTEIYESINSLWSKPLKERIRDETMAIVQERQRKVI